MLLRIATYAAVLALGVTAARAQVVELGPRVYDRGLAPYEVMSVVRSAGLVPLSRPMRHGPTYVVIAADRAGGRTRVVVDAHRGQILAVHPVILSGPQVGHPGYFYDAPRYGVAPQPYYGPVGRTVPALPDPNAPMIYAPGPDNAGLPAAPGRSLPQSHAAGQNPTQNPTVASVQPIEPAARPRPLPLPRPRPAIAASKAPAETTAAPAQPPAPPPVETTSSTPANPVPAPAAKPESAEPQQTHE